MTSTAFRLAAATGLALVLAGCQPATDPGTKINTPTVAPWVLSSVSALPLPATGTVAPPSGAGPDLQVLDWAGYQGAVSYTFDDTQPSHITYWPQIKATGVRSTWYMSQTYGSGTTYENTWKDAVAAGHEIGNHTLKHLHATPWPAGSSNTDDFPHTYPALTAAEAAAKELADCDTYIKSVIGQGSVWTMAYPFGEVSWKPYVATAGTYLFARTVNNGLVTPSQALDPLLLPTYMVTAGNTAAKTFNPKIDGAVKNKAWQTLLFHSLTPTSQNWYAGVPAADVVSSLNYGKGLGTVWLDSVVNVGSYWMAAKLLKAAVPVDDAGKKTWSWTLPANFPPGKYLRVTAAGGTLDQNGTALAWNTRGFYEVALDAGSLTWTPAAP